MPDPQPIPYATPGRRAAPTGDVLTAATAGWRTAAAAAWLAGTLAAAAYAIITFYDQQQAVAAAPLNLAGGLPAMASLAVALAGPAAFPVGVGAAAAGTLYFRPVGRLLWVVCLPAVAGCASAVVMAQYAAAPAPAVLVLAAAVVTQAGLAFAGLQLGRPVGRWLARHLVPPPLRASLIAVWV